VITRDPTGTGGVLYVAEYGFTNSFIGILNIASDGTNCTLTESSASEIADPQSSGLLSLPSIRRGHSEYGWMGIVSDS
jgi:hypothetical protein